MVNLQDQVKSSAADLEVIWQNLSGRSVTTALPSECYRRWETAAFLYVSLSGTMPLFAARMNAWRIVESLVDPTRLASEKLRAEEAEKLLAQLPAQERRKPLFNFSHDGIDMDFASARHLALISYTSVSWSIYDRLSNVCGRLAATEDVRQHYKQNPRLVEDFLAKEKERSSPPSAANFEKQKNQHGRDEYGNQLFAFSMQYHLRTAYDWPTRVAYTIRNWLVHDGTSMGDVRLFHSDQIEDGLRLHSKAVVHIENMCKIERDSNDDPTRCCLRGSANPWKKENDKDLMEVLKLYHGEVDTMLAGLLKWSVDSFVGQFIAFSARDKTGLSVAAVSGDS